MQREVSFLLVFARMWKWYKQRSKKTPEEWKNQSRLGPPLFLRFGLWWVTAFHHMHILWYVFHAPYLGGVGDGRGEEGEKRRGELQEHYTMDDSVFSSGQWQGGDVRREWMTGRVASAGDRSLSSSDDDRGKEGDNEMPEEGSADPAKVRGGLGTRFGSRVALASSCLSSSCWPFPRHSPCPKEPRPDSDSSSDSSRGGELLPSNLKSESKYWANSSTAWLGFPLDNWGRGVETVSVPNCFFATSSSQPSFMLSVARLAICGLRGALGVLPGL